MSNPSPLSGDLLACCRRALAGEAPLKDVLARLYREGFFGTTQLPGIEEEFAQAVIDNQEAFQGELNEYRLCAADWLRSQYHADNMVCGDLLLGGLIYLLGRLYDCEALQQDFLAQLARRREKPRSASVHHILPQKNPRSTRLLPSRRTSGLKNAFSAHILRTNSDLLDRFAQTPVAGLFIAQSTYPVVDEETLIRLSCLLSMQTYVLLKTAWRDEYAPDVSLDALCAWCCALVCLSCAEVTQGSENPSQDIAVVGALLACSYSDADRWDVLRDCLASLCRLKAPLRTLLSELTPLFPAAMERIFRPVPPD